MNDRDLQKIQDELMSELNEEQRSEKNIRLASEEISTQLMITKRCRTEIDNREFAFAFRKIQAGKGDKNFIYMVIADVLKQKIAGEKYRPFTASAEMDPKFSEFDNIKTIVEGFIRHVSGKVKPETLEDS